MKNILKSLLFLIVPSMAMAAVHIQEGDTNVTLGYLQVSSITCSGTPCGSGGGGSGQIVSSPQFDLGYYSGAGSTNTLTGTASIKQISGAGIAISTFTASSGTVSNLNIPAMGTLDLYGPLAGLNFNNIDNTDSTLWQDLASAGISSMTLQCANTQSCFFDLSAENVLIGQNGIYQDYLTNVPIGTDATGKIVSYATKLPLLASTQTWTGDNNWSTPGQSTFTYGITAGSITVAGAGAGQINLTNSAAPSGVSGASVLWGDSASNWLKFSPNAGSSYFVVASSITATAGDCSEFSQSGALIDTGHPCAISSGGGIVSPSTFPWTTNFLLNVNSTFTVTGGTTTIFGPMSIVGFSTETLTSEFFDAHTSTISLGNTTVNGSLSSTFTITGSSLTQTTPGAQGTYSSLVAYNLYNLTSGNSYTAWVQALSSPTSASTALVEASFPIAQWTGSANSPGGQLWASNPLSIYAGSSVLENVIGGRDEAENIGGGTTTVYGNSAAGITQGSRSLAQYGYYAQTYALNGSTVTNNYGIYISTPNSGNVAPTIATNSVITNNYGLYIDSMTFAGVGGTTNYGIFQAAGQDYFGGTSSFNSGVKITNALNFEDIASSGTLSSCGTGPSFIGSPNALTITGGSGAAGCTYTFPSGFFTKTPICNVTVESMSVTNALSYTTSATAVTITQVGLGTGKIDISCTGRD